MSAEAYAAFERFVNYYIHQVNLMRYLFAEDYQASYVAPGGRIMVTQSESGVAGTLEMGTYRTTLGWQEVAFVAFEKGWIRVELPSPMVTRQAGRVTIFDNADGREPRQWSPELPPLHAMAQQAAFFLAAVRGEPTPLCRADEAVKDLRVASRYLELLHATA
jgi:hypothetical protein